jgi:soluble lytic murein transglycosylase-like protein
LFQFMPATAVAYAVDRTSPESSTRGAAKYLATLQARFGNLGLALAAYNWGQGNLSKWLATKGAKVSSIPAETRAYVLAITGHPVEAWLGKTPPSAFGGHIARLEAEMTKPGAR